MNRLIKNENAAISAYEKAGRERVSTAKELSDWGEATEDEAVSDITDKLGVLLAEMGKNGLPAAGRRFADAEQGG